MGNNAAFAVFESQVIRKAQERRIYPQVTGAQALELFEQADWDRATYDW